MKERYEYHFHTKRLDTEVHLLGESTDGSRIRDDRSVLQASVVTFGEAGTS